MLRWTVGTLMTALTCLPVVAAPGQRAEDPVVLTGDQLGSLDGLAIDRIVAFRYDATGWTQIPVQIDERAWVDFGTIYGTDPTPGIEVLTYTDPATFTGADPVPGLDALDEVVLQASDLGGRRGSSATPPGVIAGSAVELEVVDPRDGVAAYAYLFEQDGSLDPAAGVDRVAYTFHLLSGDYKTTYGTQRGPNPERSTISTADYGTRFIDRWIRDELRIKPGGATQVDLLDRHKVRYEPGDCDKSEETFSRGQGAFMANVDGPLRAIRAYVGANSGVTTHRIHRFYASQEQVETVLRVHGIPGIMDFFDYAPAADGMRYAHDLAPTRVDVDGVPDEIAAGWLRWEILTGDQGTVAHSWNVDTDIPGFDPTSFYSDRSNPIHRQCTGDAEERAASGLWVTETIPNTDPENVNAPLYRFVVHRTIHYGAPNRTNRFASKRHDRALQPLTVHAEQLGSCGDLDADGAQACDGLCDRTTAIGCDCDDAELACTASCADPGFDGAADCATDDLLVAFDGEGLWRHGAAGWARIANWHALEVVAWGDAAAARFVEDAGVWLFDGSDWRRATTTPADRLVGWNDRLVSDSGPNGLRAYDGAAWEKLSTFDPDLVAPWGERLAASFAGRPGVHLYEAGGWTQIDPGAARALVGWNEHLFGDFGEGPGLRLYDGDGWERLTTWAADAIEVWGDAVAVDFGTGRGLFRYTLADGWSRLSDWDADRIAPWAGTLTADFGARGLWILDNGSWRRLSAWDAELHVAAGGRLVVDFGAGRGLWAYDGAGWAKLTGWDAATMEAVDLD